MSKVMLLIEEPNSCDECPCSEYVEMCGYYCQSLNKYIDFLKKKEHSTIPKLCPLRELPSKKKWGEIYHGNVKGWNDCLKEITSQGKEN